MAQRGGGVPKALAPYRQQTAVKCEELIRRYLDDESIDLADKIPIALKYSINYESNQIKRELGAPQQTNNILVLMQQAAKEIEAEQGKTASRSRIDLRKDINAQYEILDDKPA